MEGCTNAEYSIEYNRTGIGYKESIQLEKELIDKIFNLSEESRSNYTEERIKDLDLFQDLKYDSVSLDAQWVRK